MAGGVARAADDLCAVTTVSVNDRTVENNKIERIVTLLTRIYLVLFLLWFFILFVAVVFAMTGGIEREETAGIAPEENMGG